MSYSCPALKWDGRQLLYLLCKDKQRPGALRGRELPCSSREEAQFSGRASLERMLHSAGCHQAARSSSNPKGHQCCGRTRDGFSRDAHGEPGELWWLFRKKGCMWRRGQRLSPGCSEWLFAQMVQGKGRIQLFWALKGSCLWPLQHIGVPRGDRASSPWHPELLSPHATNTYCSSMRSQ